MKAARTPDRSERARAALVDRPPDARSAALTGLGPVVDAATRLVVLGSFPGVASLQAQQYYGHPRNHFWPILSALWNLDLVGLPYAARLQAMLERGVGLWDVYASCERIGSLDSAIEAAQPNDLASLPRLAPGLRAIAHNGGESARAIRQTAALGVEVIRLPSTSPANASWSFARKLAAWRVAFERHGVA
jgi:hypoxanthine-DNA glycosylase